MSSGLWQTPLSPRPRCVAPQSVESSVTEAAGLGSELGAYLLGWAFFHGKYGLPKDLVRARYWLKKVTDGECEHKHFNHEAQAKSAEMLQMLGD